MNTYTLILLTIASIIDIKTHNVYILLNALILLLNIHSFNLDNYLGLFILPIILLILNHIYSYEAIGYGDIEIIAILGLILGYYRLIIIFFVSCFTLYIYSLINKKEGFPFIPFLTYAYFILFVIEKLF